MCLLMKKIAMLVVVAILLSSCAFDTGKNDGPVKLTLWHYYNGATKESFDTLVQEFNETIGIEENILVDAYSFGGVGELADAVMDSANKEIGAEPLPDIFAAYADNVQRLDELDVVAPLDEYFTDDEIALYRPEFIDEGRFGKDGELMIVPIAKSSEIIYINGTDFNTFAQDTGATVADMQTWEGLVDTAEEYYMWTDAQTPELNDGKAMFGIDSTANFMLVATKQLGNEIYTYNDTQAEITISKEDARKLWDVYYVPFISGYYADIGRFRSDDLKAGELIAYAGSTASAQYFPSQVEISKDDAYAIECITAPYPYFEGTQKVVVQQGAGMAVSKSTPEKESAAVEFLKWFTETEQNLAFAVETGYMPVQNASLEYDVVSAEMRKDPNFSETSPVVGTANVLYQALNEYEFYASKPFNGSYDSRNKLEDSLSSFSIQGLEELGTAIANGEDRQTAIDRLSSDENFEKWYNSLVN